MWIEALWRYPVKSLQGEAVPEVAVTADGLAGDRHWALQDATTGTFLTARRAPELLWASAALDADGALTIAVPGHDPLVVPPGRPVDAAVDPRVDAALSAWLGRPVRLVEARADLAGTFESPLDAEAETDWVTWTGPTGRFHDSTRAAVSLVTTGSLRSWDPRRFRANVVLAGDDGEEDALVGRSVRLGGVELAVINRIDRCVMVTRPQPGGLERDLDVLRTVHRQRGSLLAVATLVDRPGRVRVGDELVPGEVLRDQPDQPD
jgi:uncharacterized protein YcbX